MGERLPESLVRDNLYNWLGYGNLNGRYWFIGREEYDSIKRCQYLEDLSDYYRVRCGFDYAEDFVDVWEMAYDRSVEKGTRTSTTRHYQAAFLLALEGTSPKGRNSKTGKSKTGSYVFAEQRFGRQDGNHFSGEAFPLRCHLDKPETFEPYQRVWDSLEDYEEEVLPNRIDLYLTKLKENPKVEVIISYADTDEFVKPMQERLDFDSVGTRPANKRNEFEITRCHLDGGRSVLLIDAPFFGQGHVGYSEIEALAEEIPNLTEGTQ